MLALRFAGLLALALWLGGLVSLGGIAAPVAFEVAESQHVADGRTVAGAIVGEALRRFHLVSYGCGGVLLASLVARAILGPRPRRFGVRAGITAVMLGTALYSGVVVTGRLERLREEIGTSPSSLPEGDPRRAAFGRLHAQSTTLQLVPLIGAVLLLVAELKD
jgi:hypothetical protein